MIAALVRGVLQSRESPAQGKRTSSRCIVRDEIGRGNSGPSAKLLGFRQDESMLPKRSRESQGESPHRIARRTKLIFYG